MTALRVGIGAWVALIALQLVWYPWWAPPSSGAWGVALMLTLPALLLPLFALRSGMRRALLWIGIVALFYFCHGIVAAWVSPPARVPALIESVLCVIAIGALGWNVKREKAARRAASRP